ncbi:hypothetical protein LSUB1_G005401 [Lachnellula subtilissima]|uniref:Uncharacterized protein n=1 Tax=Lachnellula subtilissima TaxID=602034 RepID=A0A8H8RXE5_9HELO|nr:hypothetical protein LSUB1_G005401 [Lachnellula subtilissima]
MIQMSPNENSKENELAGFVMLATGASRALEKGNCEGIDVQVGGSREGGGMMVVEVGSPAELVYLRLGYIEVSHVKSASPHSPSQKTFPMIKQIGVVPKDQVSPVDRFFKDGRLFYKDLRQHQ